MSNQLTLDVFHLEMARSAKVVDREMDELVLSAFWEEFRSWPQEDFVDAMQSCRANLDRFPTPSQVHRHRPRKYDTVNDVMGEPVILVTEVPKLDVEAQIDQATDGELFRMFRGLWEGPSRNATCDMRNEKDVDRAARHCVERFRSNPHGMYRKFIQDSIESPNWISV